MGDPVREARSLNRVANWHVNLEEPAGLPYHEQALALFRAATLSGALVALWTAHNRATDGTTRVDVEFLEVVAVR